MKKAIIIGLACLTAGIGLAGCGAGNRDTAENITTAASTNTAKVSRFKYHFADKDEAISCYLSNNAYFDGFSPCDIQYKAQDKNSTIDEVKKFGASQMEEFTDEEKAVLEKTMEEMQTINQEMGYSFPELGELIFIKSTQYEECQSGAYTHGTQIYMGKDVTDLLSSDDEEEKLYGQFVLWHELFHCLTRSNPDFRSDMYSLIHFTVQNQEYTIPPSVFEKYISNPDVEHHNSYATFKINGDDTDCFMALIAMEPFEKKGDSFFDSMSAALVPVDGSDIYYLPEDAENFWEIFGENTEYVVDPEECMADNFALLLTYGTDGMEYENPEIIKEMQEYLSDYK